jgi:hypothetical protein
MAEIGAKLGAHEARRWSLAVPQDAAERGAAPPALEIHLPPFHATSSTVITLLYAAAKCSRSGSTRTAHTLQRRMKAPVGSLCQNESNQVRANREQKEEDERGLAGGVVP